MPAVVLSIATSLATLSPAPAFSDLAILDQVADHDIAFLLGRNFTLPLLLGGTSASQKARQDLIAAEVARLTHLLTARGFLDARIETSGAAIQGDPVRLHPVPGALFRFGEIRIEGLPLRPDPALIKALDALRSGPTGAPVLQGTIDELGRDILYTMRQASYADAALVDVAFDLDRLAVTADVIVTLDPGLPSHFGQVRFDGSLRMQDDDAHDLVPFQPGDPYSLTAIDALRRALDDTGTFRRIRIEAKADPDEPGVIDLAVQLRDRADPPPVDRPPLFLIVTILFLAGVQILRMTSHWANSEVRLRLIVPAVLLLGGSAVEIGHRLYAFLHQ